MLRIFVCLILLIIGLSVPVTATRRKAIQQKPKKETPIQRYEVTNANAITLEKLDWLPGDKQFHPTGLSLTVDKIATNSTLFYTCQITLQVNIPEQTGVQFRMRVKNAKGDHIMPDMQTGTVTQAANALYNAFLSDTVYSVKTKASPEMGKYTFELWAMAGQGKLLIVPYMSNIAVLELPHATPTKAFQPIYPTAEQLKNTQVPAKTPFNQQ
jgi:hypothetical protein